MDKPPKVFVSYPHLHKDTVTRLIKFLELAADDVFYDDYVEPGEDWEQVLITSLAAAPTFILFWCVHSKESEWVAREIQLAISQTKRIVPVLLDKTPVPEPLAKRQWIDFSGFIAADMLGHAAVGGLMGSFIPGIGTVVGVGIGSVLSSLFSQTPGKFDCLDLPDDRLESLGKELARAYRIAIA
jgi:hypothetical protein